ncbi:MAG: hypothetical protein JXQ87_07185 [Bacteroidia bacterium]
MKPNNTIELFDIAEISSNKGNSTFRIGLNQQREGLLGYRTAGTTFGGHWHEGKSTSKNPETVYLLQGVMELRTKHIDQKEETITQLRAPIGVKIWPEIWHQLYAITDVCFVELNSLEEHIADTKYPNSK